MNAQSPGTVWTDCKKGRRVGMVDRLKGCESIDAWDFIGRLAGSGGSFSARLRVLRRHR